MSDREVKRVEVLNEVQSSRRTVAAAASVLGISERQAYRPLARYQENGGSGWSIRPEFVSRTGAVTQALGMSPSSWSRPTTAISDLRSQPSLSAYIFSSTRVSRCPALSVPALLAVVRARVRCGRLEGMLLAGKRQRACPPPSPLAGLRLLDLTDTTINHRIGARKVGTLLRT